MYAKRVLEPPVNFLDIMLPEDDPCVVAWLEHFQNKVKKVSVKDHRHDPATSGLVLSPSP